MVAQTIAVFAAFAAMVAFPILLARALSRRLRVGYGLFGFGALAFVASQLVHLPLNYALGLALAGPLADMPATLGAIVGAAIAGLSAGLCEEPARFLVLRFGKRSARSGPEGLMFGAGHGGIESILLGVGALFALWQIAYLAQVDPASLGLSAEQYALTRTQLDSFREMPLYLPLLAIAERLFTLPFHIAASMLVLYGIVRRRFWTLPLAIVFHAVFDGVLVWIASRYGALAGEAWLALTVPVSFAIIGRTYAALPALSRALEDPEVASARPSNAPVEFYKASKTYKGGVRALRSLTFALAQGKRTCLLGPNGSGKTTAIRLLVGALAPSAGRVWLYGRAADDPMLLAAKRRMGVVPQQPGMYPDLTVAEYLALVAELYDRPPRPTIAEDLGIEELLTRPMNKVSGGQQRRVVLAAALLAEPELLILDEPSAGLDPLAAHDVTELLERITTSTTVLLCTHNLSEAERLCDRVVILREGEMLVHETIEELQRKTAPQLVLDAVGDREKLERALSALGRSPLSVDGELRVSIPGGESEVPALLRALLDADVDVCECRVVKRSLEDLFLEIVSGGDDADA